MFLNLELVFFQAIKISIRDNSLNHNREKIAGMTKMFKE